MARFEPRLRRGRRAHVPRHRWLQRPGPWAFAALVSAATFLVLAGAVVVDGILPFDVPLESAIRALPVPQTVWSTITQLGNLPLILIGSATALAALATGRLRLAAIVGMTLVGAAMFTGAAKILVDRQRPVEALALVDGLSFPSGHALNSTVTYGILALLTWRSRLPDMVRLLTLALGVLLPLVIGVSRVGLGLHWPSDVLAGWLAGMMFLGIAAAASSHWGAEVPDVALPWPRTNTG